MYAHDLSQMMQPTYKTPNPKTPKFNDAKSESHECNGYRICYTPRLAIGLFSTIIEFKGVGVVFAPLVSPISGVEYHMFP